MMAVDRRHLSARPQGGLSLQAQPRGQDAGETRGQGSDSSRAGRGAVLQVSKHGAKRVRERVGLPKRAVERNAQRALVEGIGYREATGALRKYISWLYELYDGNGNNIRIYGDKVWVFHDGILITVLNVPSEHRKAAVDQQRKVRQNNG